MQNIQLEQQSEKYSLGWILLLSLLMALGPLSVDMYLPALNHMAEDLTVSVQSISNTLPAYFLGLAIGQLIYGPISDAIGRKLPLYFGLLLYIVASILCVYSQDVDQLIILRVFQALGGCVGVVIVRAVVRDKLTLNGSAQAFTTLMMILAIAPVVAPSIGVFILEYYHWKMIFIFLAIIGLICLLGVVFFLEETLPYSNRHKLNIKSVLNNYLNLIRDKTFYIPMSIGALSGGVMFTFLNSASPVMIDYFNLNEINFGLIFGVNGIGIIIFSILNKILIKKINIINILFLGLIVQAISVIFVGFSCYLNLSFLTFISIFIIVSTMGLIGPSSLALAMRNQFNQSGSASALMGSMHFFCGLLSGVILNFIPFNPLVNMFIVMLFFIILVFIVCLFYFNSNKNYAL